MSSITTSSIKHPHHIVPDEVAIGIRNICEAELATMGRQDEIAGLARPNEEERRLIAEDRMSAIKARGVDAERLQKLRDINRRKFDRVITALDSEIIRPPYRFHPWDFEMPQPEPTDPNFWWARTDFSWVEGEMSADLRDDGLHFFGGVTQHSGDNRHASFGAVALFELQANRIPKSPTGRWISTPHVELFGGLLGYTGNADITTGDLWSKCWMHRDQQLFQFGFGQEGPVPMILGQAHESETLIDEDDGDRAVHKDLPGFKMMPTVFINNINPANSLWARLEVRFDIIVEGAGTLVWADPEVLLRTFQWPLSPLL